MLAQAGARHLDSRGKHFKRLVLAKDHSFQVAFNVLQLAAVVVGHVGRRNACDLGNDLFDLVLANRFLALGWRQNALGSPSLVNHVNGLVGQLAIVDVLGRQFCCCLQRRIGVLHAVVFFKAALEPFEDVHGF